MPAGVQLELDTESVAAAAEQGGQGRDQGAQAGVKAEGKGAGRDRRVTGAAKKAPCALGGRGRGELTPHLPERKQLVELIGEAVDSGARLPKACEEEAVLSLPTWRRWVRGGEVQGGDQRPLVPRPVPQNKQAEEERQAIVAVCNEAKYPHLPPSAAARTASR